MTAQLLNLCWPSDERLPKYIAALDSGSSPDNLQTEAAAEALTEIGARHTLSLRGEVDCWGAGPPITLSGGAVGPRLAPPRVTAIAFSLMKVFDTSTAWV